MEASIWATEEAVVLDASSRLVILAPIPLMEAAISITEELTSSTEVASVSVLMATSSMLAAISRTEEEVSPAEEASWSIPWDMRTTESLNCTAIRVVSLTASSCSPVAFTTCPAARSMVRSMACSSSVVPFRWETIRCRFSAMAFMASTSSPTSPLQRTLSRCCREPAASWPENSMHWRIGLTTDLTVWRARATIRAIRAATTTKVSTILLLSSPLKGTSLTITAPMRTTTSMARIEESARSTILVRKVMPEPIAPELVRSTILVLLSTDWAQKIRGTIPERLAPGQAKRGIFRGLRYASPKPDGVLREQEEKEKRATGAAQPPARSSGTGRESMGLSAERASAGETTGNFI
ncbi:protein of unknown function [Trichlorobacter ammonificans]|uniref:Uncharacterized protein n=1 Tax=Trichlorobacter ammonificans TaxID=2916410 RepID=A0ABN8HEW3_9BACT|nr:protein of unknown function [Trichlorobacter ammonificans]